jgi:hypothetical protein
MSLRGNNVRLTEQAHQLLAEKAKNLGDSMKEVASEAIISLFKRELKYNEYIARINGLEKKVQDTKRFAGGVFILGAVVSGCVMFFVGAM